MLNQYRQYKSGEFIVVGVDTSAGGGDYSAAQFLSKTNLDVPTVLHTSQSITVATPIIHNELEKIFDETNVKPVVAYERQNGGVFELERLSTLNRLNKYDMFTMPTYGKIDNPTAKKIGWDTNTATRPKMLQELKECIDNKLIKLYHKQTVNELFTFIVSNIGKPEAENNAHDDLVMSLAIAWQLYQLANKPVKIDDLDIPDDTKMFDKGFY